MLKTKLVHALVKDESGWYDNHVRCSSVLVREDAKNLQSFASHDEHERIDQIGRNPLQEEG